MESVRIDSTITRVGDAETWQEKMAVKWAELLAESRNRSLTREDRIAALDRAIRLESILAVEGDLYTTH